MSRHARLDIIHTLGVKVKAVAAKSWKSSALLPSVTPKSDGSEEPIKDLNLSESTPGR